MGPISPALPIPKCNCPGSRAVAGKIVEGAGFGLIVDIIVGGVGAFIGGWLAGVLGVDIGGGLIGSLIVAVVGAVILLFALRLIKRAV